MSGVNVLVTGGAGYLGSHTVVQLLAAGHKVLIADDFSNAKRSVLARLELLTSQTVEVAELDLCDASATDALFAAHAIDAVLHFAGRKAVVESAARPLTYYQNNLGCTLSVLAAMQAHDVRTLVFSSSATVYGATAPVPNTEDMPTSATSPYGWTKVMIEQILRDLAAAQPKLRVAILRYFNPVGAHPSGQLGEDPRDAPNNLMPLLARVAVGRLDRLQVFGNDYDTPDGTGVRDYLHVEDLAAGHVAALAALEHAPEAVNVWNLGTGRGTSVLELLHAFEAACGHQLPYEIVGRRPGDLAVSYADPSRARRDLGWQACRSVADMCADTWRWQQQNPAGYPDDAP